MHRGILRHSACLTRWRGFSTGAAAQSQQRTAQAANSTNSKPKQEASNNPEEDFAPLVRNVLAQRFKTLASKIDRDAATDSSVSASSLISSRPTPAPSSSSSSPSSSAAPVSSPSSPLSAFMSPKSSTPTSSTPSPASPVNFASFFAPSSSSSSVPSPSPSTSTTATATAAPSTSPSHLAHPRWKQISELIVRHQFESACTLLKKAAKAGSPELWFAAAEMCAKSDHYRANSYACYMIRYQRALKRNCDPSLFETILYHESKKVKPHETNMLEVWGLAQTNEQGLLVESISPRVYILLMKCFAKLRKASDALIFFNRYLDAGYQPTPAVYVVLMEVFSRTGQFDSVLKIKSLFDQNQTALDEACWCMLLDACGHNNKTELISQFWEEMLVKQQGPPTANEYLSKMEAFLRVHQSRLALNTLDEMLKAHQANASLVHPIYKTVLTFCDLLLKHPRLKPEMKHLLEHDAVTRGLYKISLAHVEDKMRAQEIEVFGSVIEKMRPYMKMY